MGKTVNISLGRAHSLNAPNNRFLKNLSFPTNYEEPVYILSSSGVVSRSGLLGSALTGGVPSCQAVQGQISPLLRRNCRNCHPSRQTRSVERTQAAPEHPTTLPALRWPPTLRYCALSPVFELGREASGSTIPRRSEPIGIARLNSSS